MSTTSQKVENALTVASLEQLSGRGKGRTFDLNRDRLSIGRQEENDLVVNAEGVSRQHAILVKSDGNWFIRDNQSRNGVMVNGKPVRECWLKSGDVIQLGAFAVRFHDGAHHEPGPLPATVPEQGVAGMADNGLAPADPMAQMEAAGVVGVGLPAAAPKKGINRRVLMYGAVAAVVIGLLVMSNQPDEKKADSTDPASATAPNGKLARDFKLPDEPKMEGSKDVEQLKGIEDPVLKRAEQDMAKLDWTNSSLRQAEQFFRRGQREYLDHNYHRAIDNFQTALSLYRGHMLADQYLRRAVFEAEIEAKKHMELGVQYFESLQYARAIYHFNEVVNLMSHRPGEPIVTEADRYIGQAKKRLQAAELFP